MTPTARTPEERASDDVAVALPDDESAPKQARKVVRDTLTRWCLPTMVDDAELAVSELVTNAYKHGLPPVVLRLCQRPGSVRIDVTDMRPATVSLEIPLVSGESDESGRGLKIIEAVSNQSGTDQPTSAGEGKSSYASWDVDPQTPVRG